jgi:hypothetical protein
MELHVDWDGLELVHEVLEKCEYLDRACPALLYVALFAYSGEGKICLMRISEKVYDLLQRHLWCQSLESLSQHHLAYSDHTAPPCVCLNTVNSAPIGQPNHIVKIGQEFLLVRTVTLIHFSK